MPTNLHSAPQAGSRAEANSGLIWFTEECMSNGAPLETYVAEAERIGDHELAMFFRRALAEARRVRPDDRRRWARRRTGRDRRRR
jgi:hypothetical protein